MEDIGHKTKDMTLVEQTQERILEYIRDEGYGYGAILPKENELADILGVSRVVIREANSGLRALGFIETKRKRGTILTAPNFFNVFKLILMSGFVDNKSLQDMYELRLMLEIGMADLVVQHITEENIKKLQDIADAEDYTTNTEQLRQLDIKFHTILYDVTGNLSLRYFQKSLSTLFKLYTPRPSDWKRKSMMTHNTLIEILKLKDVELFRSAMRIHLEYQFRNKERNLHTMEDVVSSGILKNKEMKNQ